MMFDPVPKEFSVPELEREVIEFWKTNEIERRYLTRNNGKEEKFRFLDGPITANGPMGVHHAWGRTFKDLWQRYNTMLGKEQRYQNGFDGQGLWVEVTVERQLGFNSKRDIEAYGIAKFVQKCKESVRGFAKLQTEQSQRLGYFMDWENSYYTLSDENNYTIWHVLKLCQERGLLYRGHDVMPWCTRCGIGMSEQEMAEGYDELTHRSVYVRFPVVAKGTPNGAGARHEGEGHEYLLVWTTTPWTLTSNVAVAVNPDLRYLRVKQGPDIYYVAEGALQSLRGDHEVLEGVEGKKLLGWKYTGPFDELPAAADVDHLVIPWDEVSAEEGTGLVHIAPGCGKEDFALGKEFQLPVIAPIDQTGTYLEGFGWLTGKNVQGATDEIIADLDKKGALYRSHDFTHRYPTCWRCHTELVFRLVDEWFISMDPLREPMMEVARQVNWLPPYGLERELDWLRNMDDWMISKKRYWGLALPFWLCSNDHLHVIGSKEELFERALGGVKDLESPHRPWVDEVKIKCPECGEVAERIPDVGNVWLDAGIVPFSTLRYGSDPDYWRQWFPADFITESFPGQFRNWFYSMIAMSTILEGTTPFKTALGYASMRDQSGREMHKSWGNLIPFDEAAERSGADIMRWLFCLHNPETNLSFGWESLDEVKRRLLILWNTYSFFVTYANLDGWSPGQSPVPLDQRSVLDRWAISRLHQLNEDVRSGLEQYDPVNPARAIAGFIEELSTWYVRRSRRRFWKSENDRDKSAAYETLYECLTTLTRLFAPFMPFVAEHLYQNLVRKGNQQAEPSVHLTNYPEPNENYIDRTLLDAMEAAQKVVALGRAARDRASIRVRQPLGMIFVGVPQSHLRSSVDSLREIILAELNVKDLQFSGSEDEFVAYTVRPNFALLGPKYGKSVKTLAESLNKLEPAAVARSVEQGHSVPIEVDGNTVDLLPAEIQVTAREREGYAAMASDGYLVVLDTRLTESLVREGFVREMVRLVNDWRKAAGFNIEDRITVRYRASEQLQNAVEEYRDHIREEILATSLVEGSITGAGFEGEASFDGQWLRVELLQA